MTPHCIVAGCRWRASPVRLPLTERVVWACLRHRGGLVIGAMRALLA